MKKGFTIIIITLLVFSVAYKARAQYHFVETDGVPSQPVIFPAEGCMYQWVNNNPAIGLPASGTGNIPSFIPVNKGNADIMVTVIVTPIPTSKYAYITSQGDNSVYVVDINAGQVATIIKAGIGQQPYGVAVSRYGNKAFIANYGSNTVSVINTQTNNVDAVIPVGSHPEGLCVSPDGTKVYVANNGSAYISVIDVASNTATQLPASAGAVGITISLDGNRVYAANFNSNSITVYNTVSGKQPNGTPIIENPGSGPELVVVSPDVSHLYVINKTSGTLDIYNTTTNGFEQEIAVGSAPDGLTVSPDGSKIYVANSGSNTITVIDAVSYSKATIPLGFSPFGIGFTPEGTRLFVQNPAGQLVEIDVPGNTIKPGIAVGSPSGSYGDNFITLGVDCAPLTVEFTIKPQPPDIIAGAVTGNIAACEGIPSVSPDLQQFSVSGDRLKDDITVTAPENFEVSTTPNGGYSNNLTLQQTNGTVSNAIVYVRSAAAATGTITGDVLLTSGITTAKASVNGLINALPVANVVKNQSLLAGSTTGTIHFTGTASTYTWTNDRPDIGLAPSGTGDIIPFITVNNGITPITATFNVTPVSDCMGTPVSFTITAYPASTTITIPNAFTPNGDGMNDTWDIKNLDLFPNSSVDVYNRYGFKVFTAINYGIAWDGKYRGINVPAGTYYYLINLKNNLKALSGWVTVIR